MAPTAPLPEDDEDEEVRMDVDSDQDDADSFVLLSGEELVTEGREYYKQYLEPCRNKSNRNCPNNPRCLKGLGQKAWLRNAASDELLSDDEVASLKRAKFCGLRNLGATCYLNTFIQLWYHNVHLRKAFYQWRPASMECTSTKVDDNNNNPIRCLQSIFAMMQFSRRPTVDPEPLVKCLKLDQSQEQDQHEFCTLFVNKIQQLLSREGGGSSSSAASSSSQRHAILQTIREQYQLDIANVNRCSHCSNPSATTSECWELLLQVKGFKTLQECLGDFLKEEVMEGSNQYYCQKCKRLQDARRNTELRRLPRLLNLQLLRFDSENGRSKKINSFVSFPSRLDMNLHLKKEYRRPEYASYQLFAVLVHEGQTVRSGHYITFIKREDVWYKFNDEQVQQLKDFNLKEETSASAAEEAVAAAAASSVASSSSASSAADPDSEMETTTTTATTADDSRVASRSGTRSSGNNNSKSNKEGGGRGKGRPRKAKTAAASATTTGEDGKRDVHRSKNAYMLVYRRSSSSSLAEGGAAEEEDTELAVDFDKGDFSVPEFLHEAIAASNAAFEREQRELSEQKALQRECRRAHRERLRDTYAAMEVPSLFSATVNSATAVAQVIEPYEAISKAWLSRLFEASITEEVPPIDNRPLLCAHDKLALNIADFRVIRSEAADRLYTDYGFVGPRLGPPLERLFCAHCVSAAVELARLKVELDGDAKRLRALSAPPPGAKGRAASRVAIEDQQQQQQASPPQARQFLVGKESFKRWKALKLAAVKRKHDRATQAVIAAATAAFLQQNGPKCDGEGDDDGHESDCPEFQMVEYSDEEEEEQACNEEDDDEDDEEEEEQEERKEQEEKMPLMEEKVAAVPQEAKEVADQLKSNAGGGGSSKDSEEADDGGISRFNEDILCEHGRLTIDSSRLKVVSEPVWRLFARHFPRAPVAELEARRCARCLANEDTKRQLRDSNFAKATAQKTSLAHLLTLGTGSTNHNSSSIATPAADEGSNGDHLKVNHPSSASSASVSTLHSSSSSSFAATSSHHHHNHHQQQHPQPPLNWSSLEMGPLYYVISTAFYGKWRRFLRSPHSVSMPKLIANEGLLCGRHGLFLFPPEVAAGSEPPGDSKTNGGGGGLTRSSEQYLGVDKKYLIISEEDWIALSACYPCPKPIVVMKVEEEGRTTFLLEPAFCDDCHAEYVREARQARFVYSNASIYIQRALSEEEEWAANNPEEAAAAAAAADQDDGPGHFYKGFNKKARLQEEEDDADLFAALAERRAGGGGGGGHRRRTTSNSSSSAGNGNGGSGNGSSLGVGNGHHNLFNVTSGDYSSSSGDFASVDAALSLCGLRRSGRRRRRRNELELRVSSDEKLKEVKKRIMDHFKVPTFDQVLYQEKGKVLLSSHNNLTLAELEIEPGTVLTLKVDDHTDENGAADISLLESGISNEGGFKGTSLL